MAHVIMKDDEYLAMTKKCEEYDKLRQKMVKACEVVVAKDNEGKMAQYSINIAHVFDPEVKDMIINKVVTGLIEYDDVMDKLVAQEYHTLDLKNGWLSYSWHTKQEGEDLYDLLKNKVFKEAWDKAVARTQSTKEEL